MPNEHVDISKLNVEGRNRFREREAQRRWLSENPGRKAEDFAALKFKPAEYTSWRKEADAAFDAIEARTRRDFEKLPELKTLDGMLNVPDSIERLYDGELEKTRRELANKFGEENVGPYTQINWSMSTNLPDVRKAWDQMIETTRATVERNATRPSVVLADTVANCIDRVKNQYITDPAAVDKWKKSELYATLDPIEKALKAWEELIGAEASADQDAVKDQADACLKVFEDFALVHKHEFLDEGAPPYVRYQLLATMRVLGETVARQFATRVGSASFTGVFLRLGEFPDRPAPEVSKASVDYLRSKLGGKDLASLFGSEIERLRDDHVDSLRATLEKTLGSRSAADKEARDEAKLLQKEFDALAKAKPKVDLTASLKSWKKAYESLSHSDVGDDEMNALRRAGGEISTGLRRYLEAVDKVLLRPVDWSTDSAVLARQQARLKTAQEVRGRYQRLLDAFGRVCQEDVLFAKNMLS